eukprot:7695296-Pyramimonas_sp.AAC.1
MRRIRTFPRLPLRPLPSAPGRPLSRAPPRSQSVDVALQGPCILLERAPYAGRLSSASLLCILTVGAD